MKTFIISSSVLTSKCEKLGKVIASKNSCPILDNFLFKITGCEMTITASDSENTATVSIALTEPLEALFAVDAKMLLNALKELADQPLTFEIDGTSCTIRYMNGHFTLPLVDEPESYPSVTNNDMQSSFTLDADALSRFVRKASSFVKLDDLRPVMGGICIDLDSDKNVIYVAASDGHQLVKMTVPCAEMIGSGRILLPYKTSKIIDFFIGKDDTQVTVSYNERNLVLEAGDFVLYSRLIEGRYPNYDAVIPNNYTQYFEVERKTLLSVLKRVTVMTSSESMLIKFSLNGFELKLNAENIDYSRGAEEYITVDKSGNDLVIGLKSSFTQNILNTLEGERIRCEYGDAGRAVIFKNTEEDGMLTLQMPMMV